MKCFPKAFWQSTGSNNIIGEIIAQATPEINEGLYMLLSGNMITTYIDTNVIYPEYVHLCGKVYKNALPAKNPLETEGKFQL